ncbi:hypothetical protein PVAND_011038 [Polypedilum vanderplanki]|uniref:Uncharacterized protein n=1 Tax=Polypedilum vanderplanki TaxID=319348 RepID=A0A9J6CJ80_POLVA|nr:hypothetical protein PVAND_011038 [Polypedilum vanderplanki]
MAQSRTNIEIINKKFQDLSELFKTNTVLQMKRDEVLEIKVQNYESKINDLETLLNQKEKEIDKFDSMIAEKDKEIKRKEIDLNFILRDRNQEIFKNSCLQKQVEFHKKTVEYIKSERDFYIMQFYALTDHFQRYKIEVNQYFNEHYGYIDSLHDTLQLHGLYEESQRRYYNFGDFREGYKLENNQQNYENNLEAYNEQTELDQQNVGLNNNCEEEICNSKNEQVIEDQNEFEINCNDNNEVSIEEQKISSNDEEIYNFTVLENKENEQIRIAMMTPYQKAVDDLMKNKNNLPEYGHLKYMVPFCSENPYRHTLEPLVEFIEEEERESKSYSEYTDYEYYNYENGTDEELKPFLDTESQIDNHFVDSSEFQFMVESMIDSNDSQFQSKIETQDSLYSCEGSEDFRPQSTSTQNNLNSETNDKQTETEYQSDVTPKSFKDFQFTDSKNSKAVFYFGENPICDIEFLQPSIIDEPEKINVKNRPKKRAQRRINEQKIKPTIAVEDKKIKRSTSFAKVFSFGV